MKRLVLRPLKMVLGGMEDEKLLQQRVVTFCGSNAHATDLVGHIFEVGTLGTLGTLLGAPMWLACPVSRISLTRPLSLERDEIEHLLAEVCHV